LLYLVSLAPGPVWQDNGLVQNRVLRRDLFGHMGLALSHPLYYLAAFALQYVPIADSAWRTNLVSAVFAALAVANILLLLRLLTGRVAPAIVGTLSVALAHTFWQHAALPETYSRSAALLTAELLCLARYSATGQNR